MILVGHLSVLTGFVLCLAAVIISSEIISMYMYIRMYVYMYHLTSVTALEAASESSVKRRKNMHGD